MNKLSIDTLRARLAWRLSEHEAYRQKGGTEEHLPPLAIRQQDAYAFHRDAVLALRQMLAYAACGEPVAILLTRMLGKRLVGYAYALRHLESAMLFEPDSEAEKHAAVFAECKKHHARGAAVTSIQAWYAHHNKTNHVPHPGDCYYAIYDFGWLLGVLDNDYMTIGLLEKDLVRRDGLAWLGHLFMDIAKHGAQRVHMRE